MHAFSFRCLLISKAWTISWRRGEETWDTPQLLAWAGDAETLGNIGCTFVFLGGTTTAKLCLCTNAAVVQGVPTNSCIAASCHAPLFLDLQFHKIAWFIFSSSNSDFYLYRMEVCRAVIPLPPPPVSGHRDKAAGNYTNNVAYNFQALQTSEKTLILSADGETPSQ